MMQAGSRVKTGAKMYSSVGKWIAMYADDLPPDTDEIVVMLGKLFIIHYRMG
jgi:hypothetical protein